MKKYLGMFLGLLVWGGLLCWQGTPTITEEIAEDVVLAAHPDTEFCEVERQDKEFQVAYVTSDLQKGKMTIADDGHIVSQQ